MRNQDTVLSRPTPFFGKLAALVTAVETFWERRKLARQLAELDDHLLRDIGLTRQDVESALSGPVGYDPSEELARRAHQSRAGRRATALEQRKLTESVAEAEVVRAERAAPQRAA